MNPLPVSLCRALGADIIIGVSLNGNLMARSTVAPIAATGLTIGDGSQLVEGGTALWMRWFRYGRSADAKATGPVPADVKRPGYLEVVSQTLFLVQDFVSRVRLAADPVDILIAPDVTRFGWLEFHRAAEAESIARKHGSTKVSRRTEDGNPASRILEVAEELNADMIVTGARGLSDLKALIVGSVSHRLTNTAPMTCITVR